MRPTTVGYEVSDHIATITLNRPEKLNAINYEMNDELMAAFDAAGSDATVRCVILTGAGGNFCGGDDIEQAWAGDRFEELMANYRRLRPRLDRNLMVDFDKPLIGALDGYCLGLGVELACWCDMLIATNRVKVSAKYIQFGVIGGVSTFWRLPRMLGPAKAAELLLTGESIDAAEAERIGLVSRVLPPDDLLPAARRLAEKIAANPPLGVTYTKEALRRSIGATYGELEELALFVHKAHGSLFATEDHQEAARAFAEKREPVFKGR